ncbi:MAG: substrate-binding domain-containing protein [Treponema sp.]|jgi:LacI family transcriptional regulator|nr:substrate-binding domain-containing protein [Treponema sp.]
MSDIARELGVSTVTVSKALSGKEGVGKDLRKSIIQKAEAMGYVYNSLPRSMLKGRTYNIGILIASKYLGENSFYWIFYQRLLQTLKGTSYTGILEVVNDDDETACAAPSIVAANKIDGLILLGQFSNPYLAAITGTIRQCVFLDFYSEIGRCDCVASNTFLGSYYLTRMLLAAGHSRIAFIGSIPATTSIIDRYMGYCKAMLEAGIPYDAAIDDRDSRGVYLTELRLKIGSYTAYVCNNDQVAGGVIRQLRRNGLAVPADISLVGFDNESEAVTDGVGVTSLEVNIDQMCGKSIGTLIQHIESDDYGLPGISFVDGKIVVKQSIAPPRA